MNKKITAIGLSAGLLAGLGAGLALEVSGNAGASNGRTVMVGSQAGDDAPGMPGGMGINFNDVLKPLVDDGTITQAQADKVIAALEAAGPMGGGPDGGMGRDGGRGRDGGMGRGMGPGAGLDTVASLLGISTDDVLTAVQNGTTIAELAKQHGKTAQDVIDALVADLKAHFDAEVASGEHTQADADARIAEATARITEFVNNTTSDMTDGHMGPDDGMMGGVAGSGAGTIDGGPSDSVAP